MFTTLCFPADMPAYLPRYKSFDKHVYFFRLYSPTNQPQQLTDNFLTSFPTPIVSIVAVFLFSSLVWARWAGLEVRSHKEIIF